MKIIENLLQILFYKLTPSKFLTKAQQIQKGQSKSSVNRVQMRLKNARNLTSCWY